VKVDADIAGLVTFDEGIANGADVCSVLDQVAREIGENVLPRFERFFE
jgi:hypothetical protein